MSQQNLLKLEQLIVNKFREFRYVELNFDKCTSINGKLQSSKALSSLIEAIRFVLDCSDLPISELEYARSDDGMEDDDDSVLHVIANIAFPDGTTKVFRKTLIEGDIIYVIDQQPITQEDYKQQVLESQIIPPNLKTLVIDTNWMKTVTALSEDKRIEFIESLCGSRELIDSYQQLVAQVNIAKLKSDFSKQQKLDLKAEKRNTEKEVESFQKHAELEEDYNEQVQQFSLFRLFHNSKFVEGVGEKIEEEKGSLDGIKVKRADNFEELKKKLECKSKLENEQRKLKMKLQEILDEQSELQSINNQHEVKRDNLKNCNDQIKQMTAMMEMFKEKINEAKKEIEKLHNNRQDFAVLQNNYQQLQTAFNQDPLNAKAQDEIESQKTRRGRANEQNIAKQIDEYTMSLAKAQEDCDVTAKKINELKVTKYQELKEIQVIEKRAKNLTEIEGRLLGIDEKIRVSKSNIYERSKVLEELKRIFPKQVFGRLSQLFTVVGDESDEKFIGNRLGSHNNSIVVDNEETANDCIKLLGAKHFLKSIESFLPLINFADQKPTNCKTPTQFQARKIESFVKSNVEGVEKALLYCLSPSIVCEIPEIAEKALEMAKRNNISVMTKKGCGCYSPRGFLSAAENFEDLEVSVVEMEKQRHDGKELLMQLKRYVDDDAVNLPKLRKNVFNSNNQIEDLQVSLNQDKMIRDVYAEQLNKYQDDQKAFKADEDRQELVRLQKPYEIRESEYYKDFCAAAGVKNIGDFLEISPDKQSESLERDIERLAEAISRSQATRDQSSQVKIALASENENLSRLADEIKEKQKNIDENKKNIISKETKMVELSNGIEENEKLDEQFMQQIVDGYEGIYGDLNTVQATFAENHEIITRHFMEQMPMPLKTGTLGEVMMPVEDLPENYHLVNDQLKLIKINFDDLKKRLKENVTDVAQKTQELIIKMNKNKEAIESANGNILDSSCDKLLKLITGKLKTISKEIKEQDELTNKIQAELNVVEDQRKRIIVKSLDVINEAIKEFYQATFDDQVSASIELTDPEKPLENGVSFTRRAIGIAPQKVTETSGDYTAALAVLSGIFKVNQQQFVILDNATRNINDQVENFFKTQNMFQVINLTTLFREQSADYVVRSVAQEFSISRVNK